MKQILLPFLFSLLFFTHSLESAGQNAKLPDSLALIDLYNSTNGPGWLNHSNWLSPAPLSTWFGITMFNGDGSVNAVSLTANGLVGTLPVSLANLTILYSLDVSFNHLTGSIPATLLTENRDLAYTYYFSHNQLSGGLPPFPTPDPNPQWANL